MKVFGWSWMSERPPLVGAANAVPGRIRQLMRSLIADNFNPERNNTEK